MSASTTTYLEAEIATQPGDWLRAADTARDHAHLLPTPGERVAVIGCGTSLYMAQVYSVLREAAGHGVTDAWPASEHRLGRGYDRVLAITRSGTTTEVADVLRDLRGGAYGTVAATVVTATPGTPVVDLADPILMPEIDEQSVVQTRFATGTLALLRSHLGDDLGTAAKQAQKVLDDCAEHGDAAVLGPAVDADQITFVGRGWTNGLAEEAGLKLREAAQLWTESYPMMEYRHGPVSISAPGRVVWAFGPPVDGFAADVAATGAHFETSDIDPMADLVRVQRLCLVKARQVGLNPDEPRNLTRSIILSPQAGPDQV
ncbi:MAG: sugar isomerase [Propionibacteriales bacterium]|nr:sugar isomerase [Propionibacteriales bacterium]